MASEWGREITFRKADSDRRMVYGEVYVPDERDAHNQFMTAVEIEKMAHKFLANLRQWNVDKQHNEEPGEGVIVESFIAREGDPDFAAGSWVVGVKITKDETWAAIEAGEITGFSLAGTATLIPDEPEDEPTA